MIFIHELNSLTEDELSIVFESVRPTAESLKVAVDYEFISTYKRHTFHKLLKSKQPYIRDEHQPLIDSIIQKIP